MCEIGIFRDTETNLTNLYGVLTMETTWKFIDKTEGRELECSELKYLFDAIETDLNLLLPKNVELDIALWGKGEYVVRDCYGNLHEIVIAENSNKRQVHFFKESVLNTL